MAVASESVYLDVVTIRVQVVGASNVAIMVLVGAEVAGINVASWPLRRGGGPNGPRRSDAR